MRIALKNPDPFYGDPPHRWEDDSLAPPVDEELLRREAAYQRFVYVLVDKMELGMLSVEEGFKRMFDSPLRLSREESDRIFKLTQSFRIWAEERAIIMAGATAKPVTKKELEED